MIEQHGEQQEGNAERRLYPMAPLIRFTLLGLYGALVLPLVPLAPAGLVAVLAIAVVVGAVLVVAITSERVELSREGIQVGHPPWCAWWLRRGWSVPWERVQSLTPVATSQGGRVYYVRTGVAGAAYLLPQRVARFEEFLSVFAASSGISTAGIARLSPPWTYRLLAALVGMLLAGEGWFLFVQSPLSAG